MNILKLITYCSLVLAITSCSKKHDDVNYTPSPGLGGDVWAKGPIDKWMEDSLTKPYNISVKYRWDPWEVNLGANLVPPQEKRIIPALEAMKRIWIDPFNAETGSDAFIRKYAPKEFIMVGSAEFLSNGNMLLGQAEGGKKIALYVVNNFSTSNIDALRMMLHTIQHEFGHILHQTVMYPAEFKSITPDYTGTWFNMSDEEAQSRGFATSYSRSNPDDDFVEMLSTMLIEGKSRWEELVAAQNPTAQAALRRKEAIVVDYFKNTWKIDFYSLQKRTQEALNKLSPDPVDAYFGFDKKFKALTAIPEEAAIPSSSPAFMSAYNEVKDSIEKLTNDELTVRQIAFFLTSETAADLRVVLYDTNNNEPILVRYAYTYTKDAAGVYTFTYTGGIQPYGQPLEKYMLPLINYYKNTPFKVEWYQTSPNNTRTPKLIFTPQQAPNNYFIGIAI